MWRLSVLDPRLDTFDVLLDMSIGHEDIEPAIEVIIEKETSKTQREQRRAPNCRAWSFVDEQTVSFVVIEREHLIGEIRDEHAWETGTVVIRRVHTHSGARNSLFTVRDSG